MAAPTTLGIDPIAVQEQVSNNTKSASSTSAFDSILNTASYTAGVFGPVAVESVYAAQGSEPASIVSAAVNAASGSTSSLSSTSYLSSSSSSDYSSGSTNYLTGGYSSAMYAGEDTAMSSDVESVLSDSYSNQAYLIAVQSELGNISTQTNAITNVIQQKFNTDRTIIQNWKG